MGFGTLAGYLPRIQVCFDWEDEASGEHECEGVAAGTDERNAKSQYYSFATLQKAVTELRAMRQ